MTDSAKKKKEAKAKTENGKEVANKTENDAKEQNETAAKEQKEKEAKEKCDKEAKEKIDLEAKEKIDKEAKEKYDKEAKEKIDLEAKIDKEAKEKNDLEAKEKIDKEAKEKKGKEEQGSTGQSRAGPSEWSCGRCTCLNPISSRNCDACGAPRPHSQSPGPTISERGPAISGRPASLGLPVQVVNASELQRIFNSPISQWSSGLGPRVRGNTGPRGKRAGQVGIVTEIDSQDNTVKVSFDTVVENSPNSVWFTPGRLCVYAFI
jgi:hypothetical protein